MMGCIWLTCCEREDVIAVREELEARDPVPRILRVNDLERLPVVAQRFEDEKVSVALGLRGVAPDVAERVIGAIAREAHASSILVFTGADDPAAIARCFYAGATEVITVGDERAPSAIDTACAACAGEEGDSVCGREAPFDEEVPPWRGLGGMRNGEAEGSDSPAAPPSRGVLPAVDDSKPGANADAPIADRAGAENASVSLEPSGHRAPLITVVSGRGGCGKTTVTAALATCAARAGLRVAVLDLDVMFGVLPLMFGIDSCVGFEGLATHASDAGLVEQDIEATAMRVAPGLTLWGPCAVPEHAELVSPSIERLIDVLRGMADVIVADTSTCWGDAAAMAVASCDRCLVMGGLGAAQVPSAKRVVELAVRLGVPRTRMTCVFNGIGARGCGEEQALRFEMGVSLRSRVRIAHGGDEVAGLASFGHFDSLMAGSGPFARSVREFAGRLLQELGCPVDAWLFDEEQRHTEGEERPRLRLPWATWKDGER